MARRIAPSRGTMKSLGSYLKSLGTDRSPARLWLRSLQAAGVALLLSTLPVTAPAHAVPASATTAGAHVYLLRGVLNIFSLGLDDIAARLEAQGIPTTVVNYLAWPVQLVLIIPFVRVVWRNTPFCRSSSETLLTSTSV